MLVGLNCSKFNYLNSKNDCYFVKGSSDLIFERVWDNLSFSYKLDTQDFIITESNLIVLHHCAFKKNTNHFNVEIFDFDINTQSIKNKLPIALPNDKELFFPTCLSNLDNILVVGIGGNNFNSKIFVYDITDIHKIKLINTIHLGNKIKAPPSGILVYENFLIVTFYLTNTLKVFDLSKNNKVVFNQTNSLLGKPLSLTKYKDIVFISSHANNSINYV